MPLMPDTASVSMPPRHAAGARHWRRKRKLTLILLAIWLFSTFLVIYFARELNDLTLFGWPVSYYMAAQGLALIYLALIVIYNRRMRQMEGDMRIELQAEAQAEIEAKAQADMHAAIQDRIQDGTQADMATGAEAEPATGYPPNEKDADHAG